MESNWGRVLYSNLLASIPLFFMMGSEVETIRNATPEALMVVMVTVVLGTAMSRVRRADTSPTNRGDAATSIVRGDWSRRRRGRDADRPRRGMRKHNPNTSLRSFRAAQE